MLRTTTIFASILVAIMACTPGPGIDERYILGTDPGLENEEGLKMIEAELMLYMPGPDNKLFQLDTGAFITKDFELFSNLNYEEVILEDEISELFDPDNSPCTLPKKVQKKLKKLKDNDKGWAPPYVSDFLKTMPESALLLPSSSISVLLHSVNIKSTDGSVRNWVLLGSPTFDNLLIEKYIVTKGFNSFLYSLDCSGYLNAAIEGTAVVPGADITTSAKSALDKESSMFIGGGVVITPIAAAYYGNAVGVGMDTTERLQVLRVLQSIPNISETDSIISSVSYEVIWASNDGSSSFNGEASFKGSGGAGVGVASITAGSSAGGTLSRESSFSAYKTYFTNRKLISDLRPFTIREVQTLIDALSQ